MLFPVFPIITPFNDVSLFSVLALIILVVAMGTWLGSQLD